MMNIYIYNWILLARHVGHTTERDGVETFQLPVCSTALTKPTTIRDRKRFCETTSTANNGNENSNNRTTRTT